MEVKLETHNHKPHFKRKEDENVYGNLKIKWYLVKDCSFKLLNNEKSCYEFTGVGTLTRFSLL